MAPALTFPHLPPVRLLEACSYVSRYLSQSPTSPDMTPPLVNVFVEAMLAAWADGHANGKACASTGVPPAPAYSPAEGVPK